MLKKIKSLIEILARKREVFKMAMVTIYVTLIVAGRRTFDQVPKALKELVKLMINNTKICFVIYLGVIWGECMIRQINFIRTHRYTRSIR